MPIREENKCRYPANWKEIRAKILERAEHKCENCGAENHKPHPTTGSKVVLTIAHLDHTPENCSDENLRAWCQKCHNSYDAPMRAKGIKERRLNKIKNSTIQLLFLLVCLLPSPLYASTPGDANGSGTVTMSDVVYLIQYIFGGGAAPVPCDCPALQFDGRAIVDDTNWVRARVGDRVTDRGGDWYYLTDNNGKHWVATPDTIQWGGVDDTLVITYSTGKYLFKIDWMGDAWKSGELSYREYLDLRLGKAKVDSCSLTIRSGGYSITYTPKTELNKGWFESSEKGK